MANYILVLTISLLLTTLSMPVIIKIAFRTKFLDCPGGDPLKIHRNPTPVLGGLGIILAVLSSLAVGAMILAVSRTKLLGVALPVFLLFLLGLYDDHKGLSPRVRLMGQFSAALILIKVGGLTVALFDHPLLNLGLTIVYLVALINAVNLLDGIDGLATGIALVASLGFLLAFIVSQNSLGLLISVALLGASAGFLFYNFSPARIFLGDNGSTVLGFLLGVLAVLSSSELHSMRQVLTPLLILIVPVLDILLTVSRRLKKHIPLFQGDRDHVYDRLISNGFSQRQTTAIMYGLASCGALAAAFLM